MAAYKEVELLSGEIVHVFRAPTQRLLDLAERKFPKPIEPVPPVVTEKNVTGTREISIEVTKDPDYLRAHELWQSREMPEWNAKISEEVDRMGSLFVFKDLVVPEEWDIEAEIGAEMRYLDSEWEPREGPMGRKLDYIEWVILADTENRWRVTEAQAELSGIPLEEVQANLASFRPQVEREADSGASPEEHTG